ncbi:MAG: M42 family peptidase [Monoglobus pectinilyticus]|uniref:M42 family peptidase n=1 Tax=Monoglobus pectinilyticus TaxID=1981510 RepID=UPI00399A6D33
MKTAELITELTEKYGVSGHESAVSDFAVEIISKYCDETNIDNMGNVIGKITGTSSENEEKQKIMIEAHMDQVGFLVSEITEDGEIKFVAVGGIDVRILPGLRVKINGQKQIPGVIMDPKDGGGKNAAIEELRIYTGLQKESLESIVKIGDHIVFDYEVTNLLCDNICSGSLDNRSGMSAIIMALKKIKESALKNDVYVVFSTQEEVGLRGAFTSTYGIEPDLAIVVDVTHGTTVDSKDDCGVFELGSGAIILRGPNVDYDKALKLIDLAEENEINHKIEVAGGASGTTAWAIQTVGKGVQVLLISIPLRYMHTNVEVLKTSDVENVSDLVAAAVKHFSI